jgi:hypothetical protein
VPHLVVEDAVDPRGFEHADRDRHRRGIRRSTTL